MYTGYFAKLKYYEEQGLVPIAICGGIPNWYKGLWYKKLAPKWSFFNEWKNGTEHKGDNKYYIQHFNEEVLKNKNPSEIEKELKTLSKRRTSDKVILLCYEKPDDFCHRHLVSDWFNQNGVSCQEFE